MVKILLLKKKYFNLFSPQKYKYNRNIYKPIVKSKTLSNHSKNKNKKIKQQTLYKPWSPFPIWLKNNDILIKLFLKKQTY